MKPSKKRTTPRGKVQVPGCGTRRRRGLPEIPLTDQEREAIVALATDLEAELAKLEVRLGREHWRVGDSVRNALVNQVMTGKSLTIGAAIKTKRKDAHRSRRGRSTISLSGHEDACSFDTRDIARRRRRRGQKVEQVSCLQTLASAVLEELAPEGRFLVDDLDEEDRLLLLLRLGGLTFPELGRELGRDPRTVARQWSALAAELSKCG